MNPADEMAPTERHSAGAAAGSSEKSDQQLRAILENLQRVGLQPNPVEQDDLHSGITHRETSERKAVYSRLVAIENEMKRRGSRGFARYLVAICIGVAAALAWQSYGEAAKQMIATSAPELGWSSEAKQMIASWVQQLGWTKSPAGSEKQAAPVAQTAVAPNAPAAPAFDPEKIQQMAWDLATLRQTVEQLAAGQTQVTREIAKLEAADVEILAKITPAPPPSPPAAPARKPTPTARPSSPAPVTPSTSRGIPPPRP
jgi:hypothetical protein